MRRAWIVACTVLAAGCGEVWNDPYPGAERGANVLYSAFVDRPKHLDPVQSYTEDEARFTQQVYEAPLQYHYLKRPYALAPLTAVAVPAPREIEGGRFTVYEIRIRPGIRYQPHPGFDPTQHALSPGVIEALRSPYDLPASGTRELTAEDYAYQIKRLAHPRLHSPIFGLMAEYIVGLGAFAKRLKVIDTDLTRRAGPHAWLDLRAHALEGVEIVDRYTYRVRLNGRYPQFAYWLAMPFFAPMPWEVEKFFHQAGMAQKNFTLDWWPVGTGPYMLVENNPNARMVLARNPNFRGEPYPAQGEAGDAAAGLLADAGKPMPFVDRAVYSREKEGIPYWNKFLQGYYDTSGISSDNFDTAVRVSVEGDTALTPDMRARGIALRTSVSTTILYLGVNMRDPVIGEGADPAAAARTRALRQALAIAVDWEEYLSIFANGRGVVSHSPLTPGIFGYRDGREGMNPLTHAWSNGAVRRRPLALAKQLLVQAGYPGGRDAKTGAPLVLYLDTVGRGPGDKPRFDWWRKQFAKLGIQLEVRETDWNRFQGKIRKGSQQLFILGWNADYPDPENLMFLLHGAQSRALKQGENTANWVSAEFDALFEKMKHLPNTPERQALIDRMIEIYRREVPWIGGFHPKDYSLFHGWLSNEKPNTMARNGLKYLRVNTARRAALRADWNRPVLWPLALGLVLLGASAVPAVLTMRRRERRAALTGATARTSRRSGC